jgi:hypothetical protein
MSKAVTQEEVEDVLSSIRRLVSADKRPLAGLRMSDPVHPDPAEQEPVRDVPQDGVEGEDKETETETDAVATSPQMGALVLTPALRVAQDPQAEPPLDLGQVARQTWTPEAEDAPAQDATAEGETADEATVEEARAYDGPMVLFPAAQDSVAPQDRDAAMEALDALVHETLQAAPTESAEGHVDPEDGDYGDAAFWDDEGGLAEPDYADTGAIHDEIMQSGDDMIEVVDAEDLHVPAEDQSPEDASVEDAFDQERDGAISEDVVAERAGPANLAHVPLTAKIAALEAAVDKLAAGWEPDGGEEDGMPAAPMSAMAWEDDVELDAKGAPFVAAGGASDEVLEAEEVPLEDEVLDASASAQEGAASSGAGAFGADDQLMDEEALRDLVSEIVRAELQGALGERITRNVRKLVRREIHRALTAQEME